MQPFLRARSISHGFVIFASERAADSSWSEQSTGEWNDPGAKRGGLSMKKMPHCHTRPGSRNPSLPELEQPGSAFLNRLGSAQSQGTYGRAIEQQRDRGFVQTGLSISLIAAPAPRR